MKPKHGCLLSKKSQFQNLQTIWDKSVQFLLIWALFPIFYVFRPVYVLTSEMAVVNCCHSVSEECSRYQDIGITDPFLVYLKSQ